MLANRFLRGFTRQLNELPNKALTSNGFKEDRNTPTTCLYLRDTYELNPNVSHYIHSEDGLFRGTGSSKIKRFYFLVSERAPWGEGFERGGV